MSDDLSKVDWNRPIEAVHEDGRVFEARSIYGPFGPLERQAHCVLIGTFTGDVFDDGSVRGNSFWRIRNVAEVPRNPEAPSHDIAKRMEALVRRMACENYDIAEFAEARAIVALLEPVDADLVEARRIAANIPGVDQESILAGDCDMDSLVRTARAAIRRGRALERDSREG